MQQRGVPTIPGYNGEHQDTDTLTNEALRIGFPVLLKASAGGGGKGMRIVRTAADLSKSIEAAKREALSAFGDGTLLIEKYFDSARHIEFQIFGDKHGNAIHCFERECSIQRRYQKIIEETPSPALSPALRQTMGHAAVEAAKAIGYDNAGTVEFILSPEGNFYFLEVNTRLQVEHPVTEMVTGLDLVQLQIEVAQGLALPVRQKDLQQKGHAIECRLYAEDSANNFLPTTGTIYLWQPGKTGGMRYDTGVESGSVIDIYYDPMIAKVIAWAPNRYDCIRQMRRALQELAVLGLTTNKEFLVQILDNAQFIDGQFDTHFIGSHFTYNARHLTQNAAEQFAVAALLWQWQQRNGQRTLLKQLYNRQQPYNHSGNYTPQELHTIIALKWLPNPYLDDFFTQWWQHYGKTESYAQAETALAGYYHRFLLTCENPFLQKWSRFVLELTNFSLLQYTTHGLPDMQNHLVAKEEVAYLTGKYNALSEQEALIPVTQTADIWNTENPMEREKMLDDLKWQFIENEQFFYFFGIEKVIGYALQQQIALRWYHLRNSGYTASAANLPSKNLAALVSQLISSIYQQPASTL